MKHSIQVLALAIFISATVSGQTPPPVKIDGTGGARTAKQTRPPDNRRPRGTAVALLGWKAGIRSDAFGAIPFSDAAARIDAAGVAFVEGGQHESRLQARRRRARTTSRRGSPISVFAFPPIASTSIPVRRGVTQQAARFREGARDRVDPHAAAGESGRRQRRRRRRARHLQAGRRRRSARIFATPRRPRRCCSS